MKKQQKARQLTCFIVVAQFCLGAAGDNPLHRTYRVGEQIHYVMQGLNEGHEQTTRYTAVCEGEATRDGTGPFWENLAWTSLTANGKPKPLTSKSKSFREPLSLAPNFTLRIPNLREVQPSLIGPITDLLTFYADLQLAMRQPHLLHVGDHVRVPNGKPNSWADGTYTTFGEDAINFAITWQAVDKTKNTATLIVHHVPPSNPQIAFPATWMRTALAPKVPNWAEVTKGTNGHYAAEVGLETFTATITLSLSSGRILTATLNNPVEVLARTCNAVNLSGCQDPVRYRIHRHVNLTATYSQTPQTSR